jgi:hypothetical protein
VRTDGSDAAIFHDGNARGAADRGQTMGDDEDRTAGHQVGKRDLHQRLAFRVECRCGFIQDENRRVLEQRPGDGDALPLSARETKALFADHSIVLFAR